LIEAMFFRRLSERTIKIEKDSLPPRRLVVALVVCLFSDCFDRTSDGAVEIVALTKPVDVASAKSSGTNSPVASAPPAASPLSRQTATKQATPRTGA
jgi:hypothetical protein